MRKSFLLAPLIVFLAAGCGGSQQASIQTRPVNTQAQTAQDVNHSDNVGMSNWKAYASTQLGILFKYPSSWEIVSDTDSGLMLSETDGGMSPPGMNLEISKLTEKEFITRQSHNNFKLASTEIKTYAGVQWRLYHFKYTGQLEVPINQDLAITSHNGTLYSLEADYLEDILSSFKFTE